MDTTITVVFLYIQSEQQIVAGDTHTDTLQRYYDTRNSTHERITV